jgi:peptidoglycan hydrolase-like protein with peptidoglycan-binding domain
MTTTSVTQARRTQAPQAPSAQAASNPNAILSQYRPTGASSATARQDGLSAGVAASHKMARTDLPRLKKYEAAFEAAGKKHGVPPALLAAIASRESRGGAALDSRGRGDGGNGFGLMQVDFRYHKPAGGPYSAQHIDQAAGILKGMLNQVKAKHPDWSSAQQLRGAVAAYNSGVSNVQTLKGMDVGTTGNDYSNDVWARAQELAPHFGGKAGSAGPSRPAPSTGPGRPAPSTGEVLREGSEGAGVKKLQRSLEKLGYELGQVDGAFGPKTEAAVKKFQSRHHLEADGVVGPKTQAALDKALAQQAAKPKDGFDGPRNKWTEAPSLAEVKKDEQHLRAGMQGPAVKHVQNLLGVEADGKFGPDTKKALVDFQRDHRVGMDSLGSVGPKTLAALEKAAKSGGPGEVLGNGVRIDTNNPILKKLANSRLNNGPTGYCVLTTLNNMRRLGVPHTPAATGMDPNNPRGGLAQMLRNGGWESVPFPGSHKEAIRSPYGNATANVVSAAQYKKLVADGKVPDGAIIFQTRHGWGWNGGSSGNDMGIVRNNGRTTHNYADMPSIVYGDCKSVVIMVPKGAIKRD